MNAEITRTNGPDHAELFLTATEQAGYFTAAQAHAAGFSRRVLQHHANTGRLIRIRRGLYRFRDYPSYPREEVIAAWLAVGKETAVVSHESALDLLELSNVIPNATHITVPRTKRHLPSLPGVVIHTTSRPFGRLEVIRRDGIRVTSPIRTILDAAEAGTGPEQIVMAIREAIQYGMATRGQIREAAEDRPKRVSELVEVALDYVAA